AACTQKAVEQLTGIYIHYYVVVDFAGFKDMIDALGGVPMCIPYDIRASKAKLNIKAGPQVLNGSTALAYARLRKADDSGGRVDGTDLQRIERQHALLAAVADLVLSKDILTDVGKLAAFIEAGAASMTMSPRLADINYLVGLAFSLKDIDRSKVV